MEDNKVALLFQQANKIGEVPNVLRTQFGEELMQGETNDDGTYLNEAQLCCIEEADAFEPKYWFGLANRSRCASPRRTPKIYFKRRSSSFASLPRIAQRPQIYDLWEINGRLMVIGVINRTRKSPNTRISTTTRFVEDPLTNGK